MLRAILTWATVVRENGARLLDRNPLEGLPYPSGDSVARPILAQDDYEALRAVALQVHPLFHVALVLAHGISLRRKWATETKGMPLKDQAHAGGWKSTKTLVDVYQRADWETMREGLANRATLRKVAG